MQAKEQKKLETSGKMNHKNNLDKSHTDYLLGEVKNGRWTDARTWNILELQVHETIINRDNGCIGIYQLLTSTIFIVPNSLLSLNIEENGFMKILRSS